MKSAFSVIQKFPPQLLDCALEKLPSKHYPIPRSIRKCTLPLSFLCSSVLNEDCINVTNLTWWHLYRQFLPAPKWTTRMRTRTSNGAKEQWTSSPRNLGRTTCSINPHMKQVIFPWDNLQHYVCLAYTVPWCAKSIVRGWSRAACSTGCAGSNFCASGCTVERPFSRDIL